MPEQNRNHSIPDDDLIQRLLSKSNLVAVVGISNKEDRPSYRVAKFMIDKGYDVVGVNPILQEVLGVKVYPTLGDVPGTIDIVDVFRRADAVPPIVEEAIKVGAKSVWLQEGIVHDGAAATAREAGLEVVMDLCVLKEWNRLIGK